MPNLFFQGSPGKTGPRGGVVSTNAPVQWQVSGAWGVVSEHTSRPCTPQCRGT